MADMVRHPAHYTRGPKVGYIGCDGRPEKMVIEAIDVLRWVPDMRLANAMKYVWRVAFGGKANDVEDIEKAIFYLRDWLTFPVETPLKKETQ